MASIDLKWILELGDKVNAPIKNMIKGFDSVSNSVDKLSQSVKFTASEAREALENTKTHFRDLKDKIKENEEELKGLEKAYKNALPGKDKAEALEAWEAQKAKVKNLRTELKDTKDDLNTINGRLDEIKNNADQWTAVAEGINQTMKFVTNGLDFSVEIRNLTVEVQRMTNLSGKSLDDFVAKSREIGKVYGEDATKVAKTANAMTKQMGGSYEENLKLIEEGYKRGANINGNYLDQLNEYGPQFKKFGIDGATAIALIAKAGKDGIYDDKAISSLSAAGNSITEMGTAQMEALAGIGITQKDLAGKTTIEALQIISKGMEGMNAGAKQLLVADIFKDVGQDAGFSFVEGLANGIPKMEDFPAVEQAGSGFISFWTNVSTKAGQMLGDIGIYAQQMTPFFDLLSGGITTFKALSEVTWLQTAAQNALNFAMSANPIGLIIVAIALMIGLVYAAIENFDTWGSTILMFLGPIGYMVSAIVLLKRNWESVVKAFESEGFFGAIRRINIVLMDALLHPIEKILGVMANIPGLGWAKDALQSVKDFRDKNDLRTKDEKKSDAKPESEKESDKAAGSPADVNSLIKPVDPQKFPDAGLIKTKPKGEEQPLNVGSGSNGIKSISMTLNIVNNFAVSRDTNIRDVADKVVGLVNDRLRDAVINMGG